MTARLLTRDERDAYLARCVPDGDCLLWTGATNSAGYAQVRIGRGPAVLVRRVVAESQARRHLRPGERVQALCCRKDCCAPEHLRITSPGAILAASYSDGRRHPAREMAARREARVRSGRTALTIEKARAIRADRVLSINALAALYGVNRNTILRVRAGKLWAETAANASVFAWRGAA